MEYISINDKLDMYFSCTDAEAQIWTLMIEQSVMHSYIPKTNKNIKTVPQIYFFPGVVMFLSFVIWTFSPSSVIYKTLWKPDFWNTYWNIWNEFLLDKNEDVTGHISIDSFEMASSWKAENNLISQSFSVLCHCVLLLSLLFGGHGLLKAQEITQEVHWQDYIQ